MLKVNSTIIYGTQVCKVTDISSMTLGRVTRQYYVLSPVYDEKNTIYVPVDNEKLNDKVHEIPSAKEIMSLINNMPENDPFWIADNKERTTKYRETLESGKTEDIIRLIKTLYERRESLAAVGKKLHNIEEQIFERAEKIMYDEFALVFDINRDEVTPFILKQIEIHPKSGPV